MNVIKFRWQCITFLMVSFVCILTVLQFLKRGECPGPAIMSADIMKATFRTPALSLQVLEHQESSEHPESPEHPEKPWHPRAVPPINIPKVPVLSMEVPHQFLTSSTTPRSLFDMDHLGDNKILDPALAPNTVFYVWCGKRWFEFHHYISVLSVMKFIRPDNLIFFYDLEPVLDSWIYNTWFTELKEEFPFIRMRQLLSEENGCSGHKEPNDDFIDKRLKFSGGIYVNEYTIFTNFPIHKRYMTSYEGVSHDQRKSFELRQRGETRSQELVGDHQGYGKVTCVKLADYISKAYYNNSLCLTTGEVFYPKDIWNLNNRFGRLVRTIFYNNPEIPVPHHSEDNLIPNIAHMVWLGGGQMDFLMYLSVLSLIYVAEVDMVYIHGDGPPTGHYWDNIKKHKKLKLIFRDTPKTIYGNRVNVVSHVTDIWRVDFMIKYGGIYVDTDTIWTKKLDTHIRSYDAVGAYDWTYWNHPFPDTINFGVAIGKKGAPFWHRFQKSMDWFIDKDWSWNGLRQPYRIKERHPELVLIDPHLQVICYKFLCHPTWHPEYQNESIHHLNSNSIQDWKREAYAFHFTLPTPKEYHDLKALKSHNTMFSEIGMNVINKAGILT